VEITRSWQPQQQPASALKLPQAKAGRWWKSQQQKEELVGARERPGCAPGVAPALPPTNTTCPGAGKHTPAAGGFQPPWFCRQLCPGQIPERVHVWFNFCDDRTFSGKLPVLRLGLLMFWK